MTTDTDRLRETYRSLQGSGSTQCPSDEELAALVLGELDPERRSALADHTVACRRCTESAGFLFETHREASGASAARPSSRRRWISLAAAAAALAVIGLLIARPPQSAPPAERGTSARTTGLLPAEGAELPGPPSRFAWPPRERAEAYRVKLFHDSGELAWQSAPDTAPAAEMPADARARLEAGSYYWVVEVEGPAGAARLGPFAFRIAAPAR